MILNDLIERIKHQIKTNLPGESAHLEMSPLNRPLSSVALKETDDYRISSVAVVLHQIKPDEISLILIQRPHYEGAHSGQISFPGGKKDPTDPDSEFTARRECLEEIGLCLQSDNCLGKLTDVYIPVSKFLVHPYLYMYTEEVEFVPDEREVSQILNFDLKLLTDPKSRSMMDIQFPNGLSLKKVPCFIFDEKKVWGATALVLNELRELFIRSI